MLVNRATRSSALIKVSTDHFADFIFLWSKALAGYYASWNAPALVLNKIPSKHLRIMHCVHQRFLLLCCVRRSDRTVRRQGTDYQIVIEQHTTFWITLCHAHPRVHLLQLHCTMIPLAALIQQPLKAWTLLLELTSDIKNGLEVNGWWCQWKVATWCVILSSCLQNYALR